MNTVMELLKIIVIGLFSLGALIIILLALPQSRLRKILFQFLTTLSGSATALLVLYIFNPIDLIPDIIPLLGQIDDGAALIGAIFAGLSGLMFYSQSKKALPTPSKKKTKEYIDAEYSEVD